MPVAWYGLRQTAANVCSHSQYPPACHTSQRPWLPWTCQARQHWGQLVCHKRFELQLSKLPRHQYLVLCSQPAHIKTWQEYLQISAGIAPDWGSDCSENFDHLDWTWHELSCVLLDQSISSPYTRTLQNHANMQDLVTAKIVSVLPFTQLKWEIDCKAKHTE